ncbi:uncharacterized protein LOC117322544 [Pecten maximus]|uniref:uncharacterized protein LOC117322544 n=1 Tax=Pecten maximus TaxID=6579 RepID=UPI001458DAF9|nr:uncharacterized protein LOC117322544 [Pecten maximus]
MYLFKRVDRKDLRNVRIASKCEDNYSHLRNNSFDYVIDSYYSSLNVVINTETKHVIITGTSECNNTKRIDVINITVAYECNNTKRIDVINTSTRHVIITKTSLVNNTKRIEVNNTTCHQ